IEDLVPRTMWIQEPLNYDKHALWGVSQWGRKRQQFYRFAVNQESALDKRLNLTKPDTYQSDLKRCEAYTAYSNLRQFIYQNKDKKNRLMRVDELHKFSDGTLNDVRNALDERLKGIKMHMRETFECCKGPYDISYAAPIFTEWIEDLVPRNMWVQQPVGYDKHALWGISHWGCKRQQFYGFAVNRESARDIYSKRKIIVVTELKIVEWHNYKHLDWITWRLGDARYGVGGGCRYDIGGDGVVGSGMMRCGGRGGVVGMWCSDDGDENRVVVSAMVWRLSHNGGGSLAGVGGGCSGHDVEGGDGEMIEVTNAKVDVAKEKLKEARTRQKSYADKHRRSLEFQTGDHVFLKVSPVHRVRRFSIKGKLSPRFIGPFEILDRVGEVSYRLALPP
nr:putative reverse transcriptase domain-containing protein [Tanacetum cinerariifolium]